MILVIGATGNIGGEVVKQLLEVGAPVRVLARDPAKAAAKLGAGVEVVHGDLDAPETLGPAFARVSKAFVVSTGPELARLDGNAVDAAKAAGVAHVVLLSVLAAETESGLQLHQWHRESEKKLEASGLAWTFLRPGAFASNALSWIPSIKAQGVVYSPAGDGQSAPIDPRDIAAVAVKALTTPGHEGKAYTLTGPELLSTADQVAKVGAAIGRQLLFLDAPVEGARKGMLKAGMDPRLVDALLELLGNVRAGNTAFVSPTVAEVLDRPARTFDAWVQDNVAAFR